MRCAIVTETYPPEINGVALTVRSLEEGLRARGHTVDLIRPRQRHDQIALNHETLVPSMSLPRYPGLRVGLPATRQLTRLWKFQRPDAIYVATEGPLGWTALRAARKLGIASASGFHTRFDTYMRDYGLPFLKGPALRWMRHFHNLADATLVPTEELRTFLDRNGFRNVLRLARAVDTELFHPKHRDRELRGQWGLGDDDIAVIHLGRIAAEKNLDLAIRAYRELQANCSLTRFVWVGDGPERGRIERENPDFVFCGTQRGEALGRHFASADLFLFPSKSETYGNVTLEALASGVPTVAFDYGAAREWLRDGKTGAAIVDTGDVVAESRAFIEASRGIACDMGLRRMMRMAARDSVSMLKPQQVSMELEWILTTLSHTRGSHERHHPTAQTARE